MLIPLMTKFQPR